MSIDNPTPTEPVTESTESVTEIARRKFLRLKTEVTAFLLFILGALAALDPQGVILIFGPESRGYVMCVFAIVFYLYRRFGTPDPERILPPRRR